MPIETSVYSLDGIDLLAPLSPAERASVAHRCKWRRFAAHELIMDRLDETRDVCLIIEGNVRVVNHSLGGREISFDDISAGGFLGELSALDGDPRSATVEALENTLCAFIAPTIFLDLVANNPVLARSLLLRLVKIVRRSTDRIMDLSTLGANNRVHAELLRLAKPNLKRDGSADITPIPVHGDIAARVSTTRETVARVLSDLARDGIVERRSNALVILDFPTLERMVEDVRGDARDSR